MPRGGSSRREFLRTIGVAGAVLPVARSAFGLQSTAALEAYPALVPQLQAVADKRTRPVVPRGTLTLTARDGAYAPDLARLDVETPGADAQRIAPDGLLTFTVETDAPRYVSGELELEPSSDLRPGLRASVLCDDTLIAAPMVVAPSWGIDEITDPAPRVQGSPPPARVPVQRWLLPRGRHHLVIAGPHFRDAGRFRAMRLTSTDDGTPVEEPLYRFALIGDTHVRFEGRHLWMNLKMGEAVTAEFGATLRALAREGIDFVMHGGDMTENATRDEFALFAGIVGSQPLPVYGCMGNHDVYLDSSRPDALELLGDQFPGGTLDYVLSKPPLRFVVLDVKIEEPDAREAQRAWLRETLAADRRSPTIVVWHYAPYNRGGLSSCGFRLHDWSALGQEAVLDLVQAAPNVVATLNGHDHWDEVNDLRGVRHIQNAAFVEWPNSYRVFRVYADRIEWEVRQVRNRGFIRESFVVPKANSWMIATREADLQGQVAFDRRR